MTCEDLVASYLFTFYTALSLVRFASMGIINGVVAACSTCALLLRWFHSLNAASVVVEQATTPTGLVSCAGCEIPGRSGFAFHNAKAFRGVIAIR